MTIKECLENKRILIFGYGREGKSVESYIKSHITYKTLDIFEGKKEDIDEDKYDIIIKSPGIVMLEDNPKYSSATALFLNQFAEKTIGITGTKGKSTTSAMLAHVLSSCEKNAVLLGNIGKPCFDYIDEIEDDTIIVFELSCHQLLHIDKAPHISVFLNLFEEHLDYYGTMEKYFAAKANIISKQSAYDVAYVGDNVPDIISESERNTISYVEHDFKMSIPGEHNKLNAEFVYRIAVNEFMCDPYDVMGAIESFKGLPHRLELFATKGGIRFYDDSISTIPEASISAAESIANTGVVIIGGMDRGIDYDILVDYIRENQNIRFILSYETGKRIKGMLGETDNSCYVENLDEAYKKACELAKEGEAVVLSPAAPSYGYFKNFEERGDYFKSLVNK